MCPEMNRTGFNSYNSILIIVNKLIIRLMIRQITIVQTILSAFNVNSQELLICDNLYYDHYFVVDNEVQNYNVNQLFQLLHFCY